ncbi:MAG TPA: hypothetical protein PLW44_12580 [Chitinophagales bacterium]|nr:hypothetical protein [Chitinophagales bacterium]
MILLYSCKKEVENQPSNNDTTYNYKVVTTKYRWQYVAGDTTYTTIDTLAVEKDPSTGYLHVLYFSTPLQLALDNTASTTNMKIYSTTTPQPQGKLAFYTTNPDSVSGYFLISSIHNVIGDSINGILIR